MKLDDEKKNTGIKKMDITDKCFGRIAVVGNGPLNPEDREFINNKDNYDCIVRFNDRKNMEAGEQTTVHAVRDTSNLQTLKKDFNMKNMWDFVSGKRVVPGLVENENVFVQPVTARPDILETHFPKNIEVLNPILVNEIFHSNVEDEIFPNCLHCQEGIFNCDTKSSRGGPSTGTAVLNVLESSDDVESIDVYGMNWNGGEHHLDFQKKNQNLVKECCTKCQIFPTASQDYVDKNFVAKS
jgi:hypothetical protein